MPPADWTVPPACQQRDPQRTAVKALLERRYAG